MYENFGSLDASITAKMDADNDFQASIADLSDDDKTEAIKTKKSELINGEIKSLADGKKKSDEVAANQKKRAEKAEDDLKKSKPADDGKQNEPSALTVKDGMALTSAGVVVEEDIDEVLKASKLLGKSISETLNDPMIQTILADKVEKRKSASAVIIRGNGGGAKANDEQLLSDFRKGVIPEKGTPEAERLFRLRHSKK